MEITDFANKVKEHKDLETIVDNHHVFVRHIPSNIKTYITTNGVLDNEWDVLEEVFTMKREPIVLKHVTRIVGYYSDVANWNPSKIGELKARQAGNYS